MCSFLTSMRWTSYQSQTTFCHIFGKIQYIEHDLSSSAFLYLHQNFYFHQILCEGKSVNIFKLLFFIPKSAKLFQELLTLVTYMQFHSNAESKKLNSCSLQGLNCDYYILLSLQQTQICSLLMCLYVQKMVEHWMAADECRALQEE